MCLQKILLESERGPFWEGKCVFGLYIVSLIIGTPTMGLGLLGGGGVGLGIISIIPYSCLFSAILS